MLGDTRRRPFHGPMRRPVDTTPGAVLSITSTSGATLSRPPSRAIAAKLTAHAWLEALGNIAEAFHLLAVIGDYSGDLLLG
jgi:hypothetical protein